LISPENGEFAEPTVFSAGRRFPSRMRLSFDPPISNPMSFWTGHAVHSTTETDDLLAATHGPLLFGVLSLCRTGGCLRGQRYEHGDCIGRF